MLSASMITKEKIRNLYQSIAIQFNNPNKNQLSFENDTVYNRMWACVLTVYEQNQGLGITDYSAADRTVPLYTEMGEYDTNDEVNNGHKADVVYTVKYLGSRKDLPKIITVEAKDGVYGRQSGYATGKFTGIDALTAIGVVFPSETISSHDWQILTANFIIHN